MRKIFQKIIKENVLATNQDHKKDLTYFYNLRVKQLMKNKNNFEDRWYKNYKEKIIQNQITLDKNKKIIY